MLFVDEVRFGILPLYAPVHYIDDEKLMPVCWESRKDEAFVGTVIDLGEVTCEDCRKWFGGKNS